MNLNKLENKTILLLGKSRSFSSAEFLSQLKYHRIIMLKEYSEKVCLVIEGKMMTPYEQNTSDALYEKKILEFIPIDTLEKSLAQEIDADTLLMSLKLSHDKDRLKDFITNAMISDKLFLKLLKMYSWGGEDFFENDDNRDVSAALILRFYENIERNHNVQYATTGIIHLVAQTKDINLLKTISELQPLKFHPKIKQAIAMSIYIDDSMQNRFFKYGEEKVLEALSFNQCLNIGLVKEFLKDENLGCNVAKSIVLNDELFKEILQYPSALALNESLTLQMQEKLLGLNEYDINFALALNDSLDLKIIKILLKTDDEDIKIAIYENSSIPIDMLKEAYEKGEYLLALSKNENTPVEILYQLQLDSRYERYVKSNAAFGKHIQTQNIGWL